MPPPPAAVNGVGNAWDIPRNTEPALGGEGTMRDPATEIAPSCLSRSSAAGLAFRPPIPGGANLRRRNPSDGASRFDAAERNFVLVRNRYSVYNWGFCAGELHGWNGAAECKSRNRDLAIHVLNRVFRQGKPQGTASQCFGKGKQNHRNILGLPTTQFAEVIPGQKSASGKSPLISSKPVSGPRI
jgi:hypothetical protein